MPLWKKAIVLVLFLILLMMIRMVLFLVPTQWVRNMMRRFEIKRKAPGEVQDYLLDQEVIIILIGMLHGKLLPSSMIKDGAQNLRFPSHRFDLTKRIYKHGALILNEIFIEKMNVYSGPKSLPNITWVAFPWQGT